MWGFWSYDHTVRNGIYERSKALQNVVWSLEWLRILKGYEKQGLSKKASMLGLERWLNSVEHPLHLQRIEVWVLVTRNEWSVTLVTGVPTPSSVLGGQFIKVVHKTYIQANHPSQKKIKANLNKRRLESWEFLQEDTQNKVCERVNVICLG